MFIYLGNYGHSLMHTQSLSSESLNTLTLTLSLSEHRHMYAPFPLISITPHTSWWTLFHSPTYYSPFITISLYPLLLASSTVFLSRKSALPVWVPVAVSLVGRFQSSPVWIHTRQENVMSLFSLHSLCLVNCQLWESGRWWRAKVIQLMGVCVHVCVCVCVVKV